MKRGWEGQRECGQTQTGCVSPGFQEMERLDVQENVEKVFTDGHAVCPIRN